MTRSLLLLPLLLWLSAPLFAQRGGDFGPYQVILDRNLLGSPAPAAPAGPAVPSPAPAPSWAAEYRLTMISEDVQSGQSRAGLYHLRNQTGHLLLEGETYPNGFRLESVSLEGNHAEISLHGARHLFRLEAAPAAAPPPNPGPAAATARSRSVQRVSAMRADPPAAPPEAPPEPEEAPRFSSPQELETHLQEVQMDAIRTGKPPLPIPLTPEMDAQLVQEGVLPPLQ